MSVSDTAVAAAAARRHSAPLVRDAVPADYPAIRHVIVAAYRQYADLIARDIFSPYLADLLDLDKHARQGRLTVVEVDGRIRGFGAFYPDASVQGLGWPPGWASGRALAVHPDARGHGVARALLAVNERLARDSGAPVFAFHTASFMTDAIALYERLGYRRAPEFDFDMAARYSGFGAAPITALAYLRDLAPERAACALSAPSFWRISMNTTSARIRRAGSPAYYLARPAALWLAAFAPRPEPRPADRASCTSEARRTAADNA
jgi:GNAT superfamily N-acetyltransferase